MPLNNWTMGCLIFGLLFIGACSSTTEKGRVLTLNAPGRSNPEALVAMKAGNQAFATGQWATAKRHYEKAIHVQQTLAEAHYNLALTLDRLGNRREAETHYTLAADFAPGHPVIWNSRIYRRYGDVPTPKRGGSSPSAGMPGLGGLGGLGGGPSGVPPGGY